MKFVESIHKLTDNERSILRSLIGKEWIAIYSNGLESYLDKKLFLFPASINLSFARQKSYCILDFSFGETKYGNDFHFLSIRESTVPSGMRLTEFQGEQNVMAYPYVYFHLPHNFIVRRIDIYGFEYSHGSEVVSSQNILVFTSEKNERVAIFALAPPPWTQVVSLDKEEKEIEKLIGHRWLGQTTFPKLKYTID